MVALMVEMKVVLKAETRAALMVGMKE